MTQLRCDHHHVCWMLRFNNRCKNDGQPVKPCMFDTRLHSNASERDKALDTDTLLQTLKKRYRNEMAIIDYIEMIECEVMALRTAAKENP